MNTDSDLVEYLRRLEAELVSPDVWQSRAELEARLSPDFIEIGADGVLTREDLIATVLGIDPGVRHTEDFAVRELAPTVALLTYRSVIEPADGGRPRIALRSSIWRREDDRWWMELHQITRVDSPIA